MPFLGIRDVAVADGREGDEGGAEVADLGEQAVQLGLVGHGTAKRGGAVVLADEGETAEPGRPVLIEVSVDTELIAQGCVVRHGQDPTATAGCVVMVLRAVFHSE